jgi:hypothetical protein
MTFAILSFISEALNDMKTFMTAMNPEEQMQLWDNQIRPILSWIAAFLGISTFSGFVSLIVGVISSVWLLYQFYMAIRYDIPMKRERLRALRTAPATAALSFSVKF